MPQILVPIVYSCINTSTVSTQPVAAESIFEEGGGANQFARAPESADPPLGAEGPPEANEEVLVNDGP